MDYKCRCVTLQGSHQQGEMGGCSLWAVRNVKDQVSNDQTLYQYRTYSS